ncbi:MAG: hypothetical protein WD533_06625 [Dehalococcoidia bacterium]
MKFAERFPKYVLGNVFFLVLWFTFLVSGILFMIPALMEGDWFTVAASVAFLIGVVMGLFYYERQREEERDGER